MSFLRCLFVVVGLLLPAHVLADGIPDCVNNSVTTSRSDLSIDDVRGMTFTVSKDGILTRIEPILVNTQIAGEFSIDWRVEATTNGLPNGTVLDGGSLLGGAIGTSPTYVPIDTEVLVHEGDVLALILQGTTTSEMGVAQWAGTLSFPRGRHVLLLPNDNWGLRVPDLGLRTWVREPVDDVGSDALPGAIPRALINTARNAQTFVPSRSGLLVAFQLELQPSPTDADVNWEVRNVVAAVPAGNVLSSGVIPGESIPDDAPTRLVVDPPVSVQAGQPWALILDSDVTGDDLPPRWLFYPNTPTQDSYPDGVALLSIAGTTWGLVGAAPFGDFAFATTLVLSECTCECDWDGNLRVDIADLIGFLAVWFDEGPLADVDGDIGTDIADLIFFLACWFDLSTQDSCLPPPA